MTALILLAALCAEPRQMTIFVDGSRESQILVSELTRDWAIAPSAELAVWEGRRRLVANRVKIVQVGSLDRGQYPSFRFGRTYAEPFDPRAFHDSGRALATVSAIIGQFDADVGSWRSECSELECNARWQYAQGLARWLTNIVPSSELNSIAVESIWSPDAIQELTERYGGYDGFPQYVPPKLPLCPMPKMPWELP